MANPYLALLIAALNDADNDDFSKLRRALGGAAGEQQTGLALLDSAVASLAIIAGGTIPPPTPVVLTRTISVETGSTNSPIAAGAKSIALIFSSDFAGTIGGAAIDPAQCPSYTESAGENETLPALAYTVTAGSMVRSVLH